MLIRSATTSLGGGMPRFLDEALEAIKNEDPESVRHSCQAAQSQEVQNFAQRLRQEGDALLAALELPWSNGVVEGHVNRVKLIKRQMSGRVGFELLRCRVLARD